MVSERRTRMRRFRSGASSWSSSGRDRACRDGRSPSPGRSRVPRRLRDESSPGSARARRTANSLSPDIRRFVLHTGTAMAPGMTEIVSKFQRGTICWPDTHGRQGRAGMEWNPWRTPIRNSDVFGAASGRIRMRCPIVTQLRYNSPFRWRLGHQILVAKRNPGRYAAPSHSRREMEA